MRINLAGGTYKTRSVIASAQTCKNLVPEPPPPAEDNAPWTYYPRSGLKQVAFDVVGEVRGAYLPANGDGLAYLVIGSGVYTLNVTDYTMTRIGTIGSSSGPVAMQDNTLVLVICDGSSNGWYVTLGSNTVTQIVDPAFYGAVSIVFLDTFLIFNKPGTNQWYSSPSNYAGNSTPFDSLYIATKSSFTDSIAGLACVNQIIWIIGRETTELWYDAGNTDFPFSRVPEVLIQHGCIAPASIATADGRVFWLSEDQQGGGVIMQGAGYQVARVSTFPIENDISQFASMSDAIGMTFTVAGHTFYVITFPTGDKTYAYDIVTQQWHELTSLDAAGNEHRFRGNCAVNGGGTARVFIGDFSGGQIYLLDRNTYTDNGQPIIRQRAFPHAIGDGNRVFHRRFMADLSPANYPPGSVTLDWSDNRGASYGQPVTLPLQAMGMGSYTWWRLGYSRDRVYRLTWSVPLEITLQGAWLEADAGAS